MNSSPSTLGFFSCLKIPGLVLDSPAGAGGGLRQPCADLPTPIRSVVGTGPGPSGEVETPMAGMPCLMKGEWLSSGLWEGTEGGGWAQRGT